MSRPKRVCCVCGHQAFVRGMLTETGWLCGNCLIKQRDSWKRKLSVPITEQANRMPSTWFAEIRVEAITADLEANIWTALEEGWRFHQHLVNDEDITKRAAGLWLLENNGRCVSVIVVLNRIEEGRNRIGGYVYDLGKYGRHKTWVGRTYGHGCTFYAGRLELACNGQQLAV